jgi:hypothetical protein
MTWIGSLGGIDDSCKAAGYDYAFDRRCVLLDRFQEPSRANDGRI